jgi:hypothetical protein
LRVRGGAVRRVIVVGVDRDGREARRAVRDDHRTLVRRGWTHCDATATNLPSIARALSMHDVPVEVHMSFEQIAQHELHERRVGNAKMLWFLFGVVFILVSLVVGL